MKVAGRKIVVSTSMPGSPGAISAMASSTPVVTSTVLAPRNFWTTSSSPGPSFTTASPISGPGSTMTSPRSASRTDLAVPFQHRHLAQFLRSDDRLDVSDVEPLALGLDESAGADHRAVGVAEQSGVEGVGRGVHHLLEGDVVLRQLRRVDLDVPLRQPLTPDRHLGDPGHPEQAGPDLPVGERRTCR